MIDKVILWSAFFIGLATYSFWPLLGKGVFYIGNSFFILILCIFLLYKNRNSLVCFCLFALSLANVIVELIFNPCDIQLNEIALLSITPILWYLKTKKHARKNLE